MTEISENTKKIKDAVYNQIYPPTNPAILLEAARELYLAGAPHMDIIDILSWTLYVMAHNSNGAMTPEQRMEIVSLHFAKKMPRNYGPEESL